MNKNAMVRWLYQSIFFQARIAADDDSDMDNDDLLKSVGRFSVIDSLDMDSRLVAQVQATDGLEKDNLGLSAPLFNASDGLSPATEGKSLTLEGRSCAMDGRS